MKLNGLAAETTTPSRRIRPGHLSRPSLIAVYEALRQQRLRAVDLARETGYGRRTVAAALRDLDELGLLESAKDLRDMRRTWHRVPSSREGEQNYASHLDRRL